MNELIGGASVPERGEAEILKALNDVAAAYNIDPAAIAGIIHTEAEWNTRCVTGSYIGLTQVGPDFIKSINLSKDDFLDLPAGDQIAAYGKWLKYYTFAEQLKKYGMSVGDKPVEVQAAVLQAMQFSPNGAKWKTAFARDDYSLPATNTKQARFLGDTSIHDMAAFYKGFFTQHPPVYAGDDATLAATGLLTAAGVTTAAATVLANATGIAAAAVAGAAADGGHVAQLIEIASNAPSLRAAQHKAAQRLLNFDGEQYPKDGCAITLSVLLQEAGIEVADTFRAFDLAGVLKKRGWKPVGLRDQAPGDVGTTCGAAPRHGIDHIYVVLERVNDDEMVIADNQAPAPHFRWVSGKGGRSPTTYFLRAPK